MFIELVLLSNHLILCQPHLLLPSIFPSIMVFSNDLALHVRWPKYWSFSFSISPSNDYWGLISFRIDWFDFLSVHGTLKSLLQHYSSKASIFRHSALFVVRFSHLYMTTGKNSFNSMDICWQSNVSPFNTLSRFVIAFFPRSMCLLISWLHLPFAVILEPKIIKSVCFHFFLIYLPQSDGTECHNPIISEKSVLPCEIPFWGSLLWGIFGWQECVHYSSYSYCCCLVTSVMSASVWPYGLQPARLPCPWDSLDKSARVGCHALLQGIFLTQGSNLGLLHFRQILCPEPPGKIIHHTAAAKSLQSCPTLCDPIDSSPPGSSVPGILQARTLEWVAISFSNAWKWKVKGKSLSRVRPSATPWTAAFQAPPSMGFSRQEYWSGVPLPYPLPYLIPCKCYQNSCQQGKLRLCFLKLRGISSEYFQSKVGWIRGFGTSDPRWNVNITLL